MYRTLTGAVPRLLLASLLLACSPGGRTDGGTYDDGRADPSYGGPTCADASDPRCGLSSADCSMWDAEIAHCVEESLFEADCYLIAPFESLETCCHQIDPELNFCERVPAPGECLFGDIFTHTVDIGAFDISSGFVVMGGDPLTDLQREQIVAGMVLLGNQIVSAEEAFERTDDRLFFVSEMVSRTTDHPPFTLYSYHAGDNPMDFIFIAGTTELVAGVGDDSVFACTVSR